MNKKYIICGVVGIIIIGGICFFKMKSQSVRKTLKEAQSVKSYELVGNMEMLENDELKTYQVTSSYAKLGDQDYYKVELYDKSLNQAQIIVRNHEGVFVLTPSLNQIFQFKSEWPMNSPKPYIYQSLLTFLDDNKLEKIDRGYLVNGKMSYENDKRVYSQEIKFDKKLNPIYVHVYDKDGRELIKVEVTSFKVDNKMSEDDFKQNSIMKKQKQKTTHVSSSLPLYPVALMGSTLTNENVSNIDDITNHILKFTGDKSFTIIESTSSKQNDYNTEYIDCEVIDMIDGFAYEKNNKMTYVTSGVVSSLYSHDLTKEEMLEVLSSMQASQVK